MTTKQAILVCHFLFAHLCLANFPANAQNPTLRMAGDHHGISELTWKTKGVSRNYIDPNDRLGIINLKYSRGSLSRTASSADYDPKVITNTSALLVMQYDLPDGLLLNEKLSSVQQNMVWTIEIENKNETEVEITDLSLPLRIGKFNRSLIVQDNLSTHASINGHASFMYWIPYSGKGDALLMTPEGNTSLEYFSKDKTDRYEVFIHSKTSVDREKDTWRIPSSSVVLGKGKSVLYTFRFGTVHSFQGIRDELFSRGSLDVRIVPGMTVPNDLITTCLIRTKEKVREIDPEFENETIIKKREAKNPAYTAIDVSFSRLGENLVSIKYGRGKIGYFNFFSTEPLEELIKKRSAFIVANQQIRDSSKWYNGLFSIWDMENGKLLSPDDKGPLPDFVVGGSDDPSNCKPLYVSEKNIVFPDAKEIASLEYYEKNFVWGKLQRTGDEYPYPYGIYGSENWYQNRSGLVAGYNSGGRGKERMWRTFDYVTHIAIYLNLYRIAKQNPKLVTYLDSSGYLDRSYRTAMAFFEVPYNIEMGERWAFHGWTDWAYKQGNFHERYIIELIDELEKNNELEKAANLRREWEKKVKYFIYDDPWPFGSEMDVDRTAFESSYYIAEYAKEHILRPQEKLWYDKNKKKWYSHLTISDSATDVLMQNQLQANLAMRGTIEPAFNLLGTAWAGSHSLDYMSQMGGVAILDYGLKFSNDPATYINIGYSSALSSWALMNTGTEKSNYGYWFPGKINDGAVGWVFTPTQRSKTYFNNIPAKRWVWQFDGEIDHGLVGAIHSSRAVLIDDPNLGLTCYGCTIYSQGSGYVGLIPRDGVRRRINFPALNKEVSLDLLTDGLAKDSVVTFNLKDAAISFSIENRTGENHTCQVILTGLGPGNYLLKDPAGNELLTVSTDASGKMTCNIPLTNKQETFMLVRSGAMVQAERNK